MADFVIAGFRTLMLKHHTRSIWRRLALSCISAALAFPATTFDGAVAAVTQSNKSMGQVLLLPPEREQTPETIGLVQKYLQEGKKLYDNNEFDKAITKFQDAYGLANEIKFGDGEGMALTEMCNFYMNKGQLPRARELGENAVELLAPSTDKKACGQARAALAQVYLLMDNTYMAMQQLELAMQCFMNLGAADSEEAAKVLVVAADFGMRLGKVKEALQLYEGAARYHGQAGKTRSQVMLEIEVADELLGRGFLVASEEEAAKAVSVARTTKSDEELQSALSCLANAQFCLWEFPQSRKTYEEALSIKLPNEMPIQRALILEGYGHVLAATGDLDQARTNLEKSLAVIKTQGAAAQRAQLDNALGVIHVAQNNYGPAIQLFKNASEAAALINVPHDRLAVSILQNLAAAQSRAGENRNAKQQLLNALQLCNTKSYKNPMLEARTLAALGEVSLNLKEYPDAEQAVRKGIAIAQGINDDEAQWRLYTLLGRIQGASGQSPAESLNSAVSFFRSPQAGEFANPTELLYPSRRDEMAQELVQLLVQNGLVEPALLAAEQLKEEGFITEWHRRGGEVRSADRDVYNDMVARRAHLHACELSAAPNVLMKEWKEWLLRYQHIAAESPALAKLIAPIPINLQDTLKTVQANHAVVVDYLVGQHQTNVFIIDAQRHLSAVTLNVGKEQLQPQVSAILTASSKSDESAVNTERRNLQILYTELLTADVRKFLPTNAEQTVVVVPDQVLYNLPFAALISSQGKFLIEDHTLTMAPSLTMLMDSPHEAKEVSVVVAADKTGEESECGQISSVFDPQQVVTLAGKGAEINNFQEQAKSTSVIHFTHALAIPQNNPLHSEVPLVAGEQGHQSKVTANGLFELNLPSDLAVLSASSINAKDYKGNSVQVFSRGFNYAGVRNVLMSLWVEPDPQRTSELVEFYRGRQKGLNQAQSLRKAQLLALSKDPSPRSWAAFQLLGPGF